MKRLPVTRSSRPSPLRSTSVEAWPCDHALSIVLRVHWSVLALLEPEHAVIVPSGGHDVVSSIAVDVEDVNEAQFHAHEAARPAALRGGGGAAPLADRSGQGRRSIDRFPGRVIASTDPIADRRALRASRAASGCRCACRHSRRRRRSHGRRSRSLTTCLTHAPLLGLRTRPVACRSAARRSPARARRCPRRPAPRTRHCRRVLMSNFLPEGGASPPVQDFSTTRSVCANHETSAMSG